MERKSTRHHPPFFHWLIATTQRVTAMSTNWMSCNFAKNKKHSGGIQSSIKPINTEENNSAPWVTSYHCARVQVPVLGLVLYCARLHPPESQRRRTGPKPHSQSRLARHATRSPT